MKTKLYALVGLLLLVSFPAAAQQLDNLNFDQWSKKGGCWNPYAKDAKTKTWDTANHGLSILGINGTMPEFEHVAVSGSKAAAKIETKKVLGILVSGNIYTGRFLHLVKMSGAVMEFGIPFKGRPKSLSGYVHYQPGKIDVASDALKALKGSTDTGCIEISLQDWDGPETVDSTSPEFKEMREKPQTHRIGYGKLELKKNTGGYIPFEIPIEYVNGKTPRYIVIVCTSSKNGQQFTGSTDSVMYLDEFRLNY